MKESEIDREREKGSFLRRDEIDREIEIFRQKERRSERERNGE